MNISHQKQVLSLAALLSVGLSFSTMAATGQTISCKVKDSLDFFNISRSNLIYSGNTFTLYQLIDGLTIIAVNNQTLKFNRLTNLNLLPTSALDPNDPPVSLQFFSGSCRQAAFDNLIINKNSALRYPSAVLTTF
jgi:hypothetical protein